MTWGDVVRAEYRVLGPLEVLLDGEPVTVPSGRSQVCVAGGAALEGESVRAGRGRLRARIIGLY